jgi:hypothetical protein
MIDFTDELKIGAQLREDRRRLTDKTLETLDISSVG